MSNFAVYKKTFIFSWLRLLIDLLALAVLAVCTALGFAIGGGSMLGLGGGFLIVPALVACWPVTARRSELLPTPLRPRTQVILPISAVSETPRRACAAP